MPSSAPAQAEGAESPEEFGGSHVWRTERMRDPATGEVPDNIRALRASGHETIVVRNSTNRDLAGPGAETWEDIEALIRDRVARWKEKVPDT